MSLIPFNSVNRNINSDANIMYLCKWRIANSGFTTVFLGIHYVVRAEIDSKLPKWTVKLICSKLN
jgi:hypothetical protein